MLEQIKTVETPTFRNPQELLAVIESDFALKNAMNYVQPSYKASVDLHAAIKDLKISPATYSLKQDIIENARTQDQLMRIFEIIRALAANLEKEKEKSTKSQESKIISAKFKP